MSFEKCPVRGKLLALLALGLCCFAGDFIFSQHDQAAAQVGAQANSQEPLVLARALVIGSGMSRSFSVIIPQFMDQIGTNLTQTRPELIRDLNTVLTDLKPEFDKQADEMIDIAAHIYVRELSPQDLKSAVAFFQSEAGKKYVETQPAFLTEVVTALQGWQSRISTSMMARVREEMKKKGHEI
jgi:uncharacterized protein